VQPGTGSSPCSGGYAAAVRRRADGVPRRSLGGADGHRIADAAPDAPFPARLIYVAPAVDPGGGTIELRFAVAEPTAFLRPELTVSVNLDVARREATVALPLAAIRDRGDRATVGAGGRPETASSGGPLRLGIRGDERIEVLEGVREGEASW
jgi:HlyD family secretion protein